LRARAAVGVVIIACIARDSTAGQAAAATREETVIFEALELAGAYAIHVEPHRDVRGYFGRTFCRAEFARCGIEMDVVQANVSFNEKRGTLRGLHFQVSPHAEAKLVSCARGAAFDVIVDLRSGSASFGRWTARTLRAGDGVALYVPKGMAHGFQTIEDATELTYLMSAAHEPSAARGVRWNDPVLGIHWPSPSSPILSDHDARLPVLADLGRS
jgi:dTDP-4-dehydrorhamnose 3,5-epimerase